MFEIMRDHAVGSVWCSPGQDNQIIVKAQRITKAGGAIGSLPIMNRQTTLPVKQKYFHVFSIGQADPRLLGLLPNDPFWVALGWIKFSDAVNKLPLFCDLYSEQGIHIPLHNSYYKFTEDRSLVFCVETDSRLPIDYDQDGIYLRLYTNAYYQSAEAQGLVGNTKTTGRTILGAQDLLELSATINGWRAQGGEVFCYVNGLLRKTIDVTTAKNGDLVEAIQDLSIKRVVELEVKDLFSFMSTKDSCYKYLLHYPETTDQIIDFCDDIDLYVLTGDNATLNGNYLHRNSARTMRMVTYRDYSVSVDHYEHIALALDGLVANGTLQTSDFRIRLYIRNSGFSRPLVFEHQRLFELYKLPEEKVKAALVGMDANMPYWSADNLENSAFIQLLSEAYEQIDIDLIERAYGYNAISKYLGDVPVRGIPHGEFKLFKIPPGLISNATIFEYDADGLLLAYYYSDYAEVYISRNTACEMIEVVSGRGDTETEVFFGTGPFTLPSKCSFRLYKRYLSEGLEVGAWEDVTDSESYTLTGNTVTWTSAEENFTLMLRTDRRFLCYDLDLVPIAGTLYFTLSEISGGLHRTLPVPLGDLDIFLNGKSCIKGLDVFVDFPMVHIVNKDYLVQPAGSSVQKLTVRYSGFAEKKDGKLVSREIEDRGFIVHGVLSNNDKYDIREDKVLRVTVKGKLKHRDQIVFSEEHEGVSIINEINGLPYQVKEIIVPLKELTLDETYALRQQSLLVDKAVGDYMSLKLPQPVRNAVSAMYNRHRLFSPFFSHLLNDIVSGQFNLDSIRKELTEADVLEICQPYEALMRFDPINEANAVDQRFVVIHPHQLDATLRVDVYAYLFLKQVAKLYGRNLVDLANHLTVINGE